MPIISFPIDDDKQNSLFAIDKITKKSLVSKLYLLLLTDAGSVYFNREFGTNLRKYIFEPNDNVTSELIRNEITTKVNKYIPELKIRNVNVEEITEAGKNQVNLIVNFLYSDNIPDVVSVQFI